MRWLLMCSVLICCAMTSPVQAQNPPTADDCAKSARVLKGLHDLVCELFAKVLIAEGRVSDANDAYRQAIQRRQDLAREITQLIQINQTRPLTQEEAQRLTELINQQVGAENNVIDKKRVLDEAEASLNALKSQWQTVLRLEREEQAWFDANCEPLVWPNPNPVPDPNFP